ncbi:ATP-binding protein [Bartonella sp. A05]|uniref:ATP-binding protein n=1 Tax=Bartonella sp. A05 TaxID=2967261 RepID=UPI0022A9A181|nr:ATP-binding protein [Bartonella sp. A05]MCZ2204012.1 ATP-binding protein [Bartonella sp. A05]
MKNQKTPLINLKGAMDLIKKSKYPLTPLYEAMTNSLEAIAQRQRDETEPSEITVKLHFTGLLEQVKEISKIEIIDNGIGFTDENYARFIEFFDKSKGYNNRGSGRLQYLHRFKKIDVYSIYLKNDSKYERRFSFSLDKLIYDESDTEITTDRALLTKVILSGCLAEGKEKAFFDNLTIDDLLKDIVRHFLLRFYLDSQKEQLNVPLINIEFIKNNTEIETKTLNPKNLPTPSNNGDIEIAYLKLKNAKTDDIEWEKVKDKYEIIKWAHFKLPEAELEQNGVYLCSKDIPVQLLNFKEIKKKESINEFRYLTAFYGDVLDRSENVSDTVDSFQFPYQQKVEDSAKTDLFFDEKAEYIFMNNIEEKINEVIPTIYKDIFDLQKEKNKNVESIAKAHGISVKIASQINTNLTDDEKTITKKIYAQQSNLLAEKGYQVKKLYESLNQLNPISENYQNELKKKAIELSELIENQNKEELSRYIIRRDMVADILKKILAGELECQTQKIEKVRQDKEGLIHDLIFKRKSKNSHDGLNDLWILNEEFLHFSGCSELRLNQIKDHTGENLLKPIPEETINHLGIKVNRRPDIFLFAEEGKCVLVEFKAPDVDLTDHLNQMTKYCNLIANYSVRKFDKFYCYLIGEEIKAVPDLPGDYEKTVNGDWLRANVPIKSFDENRNTIATHQIEIIKLSSIYSRAHRRNRSFAEKLGLPDLLTK